MTGRKRTTTELSHVLGNADGGPQSSSSYPKVATLVPEIIDLIFLEEVLNDLSSQGVLKEFLKDSFSLFQRNK